MWCSAEVPALVLAISSSIPKQQFNLLYSFYKLPKRDYPVNQALQHRALVESCLISLLWVGKCLLQTHVKIGIYSGKHITFAAWYDTVMVRIPTSPSLLLSSPVVLLTLGLQHHEPWVYVRRGLSHFWSDLQLETPLFIHNRLKANIYSPMDWLYPAKKKENRPLW